MSILRVATIEPEGATTTLTLGLSGDTVTSSADSIKVNTFKDAGGNTLWTSDGSGTLSSINSALPGGQLFISTQTASGDASISFTSGIDSTYAQYMWVFTDINPATDNVVLQFQVSSNGGSSYGIAKTSSMLDCYNGQSADTSIYSNTGGSLGNQTAAQYLTRKQGNGADESAAGYLKIYTPSNTTYVKHYQSRFQVYANDNYALDCYNAGFVNTTSAVNAIQFTMSSGNFDGKITMYGVA